MRLKFLFSCLSVFFVSIAFSQAAKDSLLLGSWEMSGSTMHGVFYPVVNTNQYISFYPDHVYQRSVKNDRDTLHPGENKPLVVEIANWQTTEDFSSVILTNIRHIPADSREVLNDKSLLSSIDDTSLVLGTYEGETPVYIRYKKVQSFHADVLSAAAPSELYRFYLVNSFRTDKRIELTGNSATYFLANKTNPVMEDASHSYDGLIEDIHDSAVTLKTYSERNYNYTVSGNIYETNNSFVTDTFFTVPVNQIRSISYSSPRRSGWNSFAATVISVSFFDILIAAPLASIKYKQGGFNSQRYFNMAGIGLGALVITIPLAFSTMEKTYQLTEGKYIDSKHWRLVRE